MPDPVEKARQELKCSDCSETQVIVILADPEAQGIEPQDWDDAMANDAPGWTWAEKPGGGFTFTCGTCS